MSDKRVKWTMSCGEREFIGFSENVLVMSMNEINGEFNIEGDSMTADGKRMKLVDMCVLWASLTERIAMNGSSEDFGPIGIAGRTLDELNKFFVQDTTVDDEKDPKGKSNEEQT